MTQILSEKKATNTNIRDRRVEREGRSRSKERKRKQGRVKMCNDTEGERDRGASLTFFISSAFPKITKIQKQKYRHSPTRKLPARKYVVAPLEKRMQAEYSVAVAADISKAAMIRSPLEAKVTSVVTVDVGTPVLRHTNEFMSSEQVSG